MLAMRNLDLLKRNMPHDTPPACAMGGAVVPEAQDRTSTRREAMMEKYFKDKFDPDCKQGGHPWTCGCPLEHDQELPLTMLRGMSDKPTKETEEG